MIVGVDIGTTSVKMVAVERGVAVATRQDHHNAAIGRGIQDTKTIIGCVLGLMETVEGRVRALAVCGQMHGVCTWNGSAVRSGDLSGVSPLYTWEYEGVPKDILESLGVHPGYGCGTLAYLSEMVAPDHDSAGTVMDLFVFMLCQLEQAVISTQNAFSWGCCDGFQWNVSTGCPWYRLLPSIVRPESAVGRAVSGPLSLRGALVFPALGDLQATMFPMLSPGVAVLNIGTSSQLCFMLGEEIPPSPVAVLPFFEGRIGVIASMNGGNVVSDVVEMILRWADALRNAEAEAAPIDMTRVMESLSSVDTGNVHANSRLHAERGIDVYGCSLGGLRRDTDVFQVRVRLETGVWVLRAVSSGVVDNIFSLLPPQTLENAGVTAIRLAGSANQPRFRNAVERYGIRILNEDDQCSAPLGAVRFVSGQL